MIFKCFVVGISKIVDGQLMKQESCHLISVTKDKKKTMLNKVSHVLSRMLYLQTGIYVDQSAEAVECTNSISTKE